MLIDYEHWDFSLGNKAVIAGYSLLGGLAVGWLFYDSVRAGFALSLPLLLTARFYRAHLIARRKEALLLQFRDLLYSVSSSISVGRSMKQALQESMMFWQGTYTEKDLLMIELAQMDRRMTQGNVPDLEVLQDFARRSGLPDVADFVNVYENCRSSGANLIRAIDRATTVISDKITLEKEMETLMAQKRFEGRIIMAAPFAIMLFLRLTAPQYLAPMTASPQGYVMLSLALALIGAACLLTERTNRIVW